jgi:hypothetical protein
MRKNYLTSSTACTDRSLLQFLITNDHQPPQAPQKLQTQIHHAKNHHNNLQKLYPKKNPKNMEYSPMKECDIFNLPTFKPTQISPQNAHHQLPKVHKKKSHQNNFQTLTQRKSSLKKWKILDLRRSRRTMRPDSDPNHRSKKTKKTVS